MHKADDVPVMNVDKKNQLDIKVANINVILPEFDEMFAALVSLAKLNHKSEMLLGSADHGCVNSSGLRLSVCMARQRSGFTQKQFNVLRTLTDRNCGKSLQQVIEQLNQYLRGWWNYYRLTEARHVFKSLNG